MADKFSLLKKTEEHMGRVKLPIVRESHLYPTEASVVTEELNLDGTPKVIGTCQRAAYYRYTNEYPADPYTSYTYWIFNSGKALELSLTELWKQMGIWIDSSVRFYNKEYNISGELDCIIKDPNTNEPVICELKSYAGYNAKKEIKHYFTYHYIKIHSNMLS
jgi:hypothetical protein